MLTPGNVDDRKAVPHMARKRFGKLFADKGYISQKLFEELLQTFHVQLITGIRSNMKNQLMPLMDKLLLRKRAIAETFDQPWQSPCFARLTQIYVKFGVTVVGVHKSSISRELKRNRGRRDYRPQQAHEIAVEVERRTKAVPRIIPEVWATVDALLKQAWSPEQISGRLKKRTRHLHQSRVDLSSCSLGQAGRRFFVHTSTLQETAPKTLWKL